MSEESNYVDAKSPIKDTPIDIGKELLDVLIRGVTAAKDASEASDGQDTRGWCVGYYLDTGHSCALVYHNPQT